MTPNNGKASCSGIFFQYVLLTSLLLGSFFAKAQQDSSIVDKKKITTLIIASGAGYTAGLATLNHLWYKNTDRQPFRFFNDNTEWKQMDKA
ncbi:MAG TPA: hypothetical protein VIQ51_14495, partial [Chryseosolibacter sp.]